MQNASIELAPADGSHVDQTLASKNFVMKINCAPMVEYVRDWAVFVS